MHGSINKTIASTHANTTSRNMVADPTRLLLAEVRRFALAQGFPSYLKIRVCVKVADTGEEIARLTSLPEIAAVHREAEGLPELSATQKRILATLMEGGAMKGSVLAQKMNLSGPGSLRSKRGIQQLMQMGLIENDEETGYALTVFGEDVAERVVEG